MAKREFIVGLEIGTSKAVALVAEARKDGTMTILGAGEEASKGVRKGEIVDLTVAQKCATDALYEAEERTDVVIEQVFVSVTGNHIEGFNQSTRLDFGEEKDEVTEEDVQQIERQARQSNVPGRNVILHSIIQSYRLDGKDSVLDPVGMPGSHLEADFHVVHGVRTRIQNTVRCVREMQVDVGGVVFAPFASSQAILTTSERNLGSLVIDFGGGTCDYMLWVEGKVQASGCLAIGGDHITNDIHVGLSIPTLAAEALKIEEGSALTGNARPGETIYVKDETGLHGKDVSREALNTIISLRVRETLLEIRRRLETIGALRQATRVSLTGGTSLLHGIDHVAGEIFELPAALSHPPSMTTSVSTPWDNPRYSTAIGMIKYAQALQRYSAGRGERGAGLFDWLRDLLRQH